MPSDGEHLDHTKGSSTGLKSCAVSNNAAEERNFPTWALMLGDALLKVSTSFRVRMNVGPSVWWAECCNRHSTAHEPLDGSHTRTSSSCKRALFQDIFISSFPNDAISPSCHCRSFELEHFTSSYGLFLRFGRPFAIRHNKTRVLSGMTISAASSIVAQVGTRSGTEGHLVARRGAVAVASLEYASSLVIGIGVSCRAIVMEQRVAWDPIGRAGVCRVVTARAAIVTAPSGQTRRFASDSGSVVVCYREAGRTLGIDVDIASWCCAGSVRRSDSNW